MYPTSFEYLNPKTIQEVIELLKQHGEDANILAGGQSLIPLMKLRVARPRFLIDINGVRDLGYIRERNGYLQFGALARHEEIRESALVREKVPMMAEAAGLIGDVQVRNLGTIGGAIVEADPAGDWGAVILALNARIRCIGPQGERELDSKEFFTFAYTTALEADEMVLEISVPTPRISSRGAYCKLERIAGDFSVASVAVQADINGNGICQDIGIGLGGAHDRPLKAEFVEEFLRGKELSAEVIRDAAKKIMDLASPIDDSRGSSAYKTEVLGVVFRRAMEKVAGQRRSLAVHDSPT